MDSLDAANIDSQRISESIVVDNILDKFKGADNYKRVIAFDKLLSERLYQESLHKKTGQDPISIPGELILMYQYLQKAFEAYAETFGDPGEKPTTDVIRKITAIGLRALENYGCPYRDIEGSLAARPPEHRADKVHPCTCSDIFRDPDEKNHDHAGPCRGGKEPGTPDLSELDGADQGC